MRDNWFAIPNTPNNSSGIYEWRIDGVGVYVGQAKRLSSRMRAYPNNVRRILDKLPWRKNSKRDFRCVHHALRAAYEVGTPVTFTVLENCPPQLLNEREQYWIALRRSEFAGSGLKVLNSN
jgi:hypothetical protein